MFLLDIDLQMFSEDVVADAPTPSESTEGSDSVVSAPQLSSRAKGPETKVIYGIQDNGTDATASDAQEGSDKTNESPTVDRRAKYAEIKKEFKDLYDQEVQGIVKDRFKKYSGIEQELSQYKPIINALMEQHQSKDVNELYQRVMRNTYEEIADRDGLTVEQVEKIMQLRSENEYLRSLAQEKQTYEKEQQINETVAGWYKQADEIKSQYPDFNLDEWAGNAQFMQLLQSGIDVRTAYEVVNIDNIKATVAKTMEQNVYQNVRAKGQRPVENATKIVPGVVVKASVKDLDKNDRAEIARRVAMGETIKFD